MAVPNWKLAADSMPDIGRIFLLASQINSARLRNEQNQLALETQRALPGARAAFMQGDKGQLMQLAPQEALVFEQRQAQQAAAAQQRAVTEAAAMAIRDGDYTQLDQLDPERGQKLRQVSLAYATKSMDAQRKKMLLTARLGLNASEAISKAKTPEELAKIQTQVGQSLGQMVANGMVPENVLQFAKLNQEGAADLANKLRREVDTLGDEQLSGAAAEAAMLLDYRPHQMAQAIADDRFPGMLEKVRQKRQTQVQEVRQTGVVDEIPTSVKADLIRELRSGQQELDTLSMITDDKVDRVAGWLNQKKVSALSLGDALGGKTGADAINWAMNRFGIGVDDANQFISDSQEINKAIEGGFIQSRQAATGAAFSRAEDRGLRKVFANIEMPPERLKAAIRLRRKILQRDLEIAARLLYERRLTPDNPSYEDAFEEMAKGHAFSHGQAMKEIEALQGGGEGQQTKAQTTGPGGIDKSSVARSTARRVLTRKLGRQPTEDEIDDAVGAMGL